MFEYILGLKNQPGLRVHRLNLLLDRLFVLHVLFLDMAIEKVKIGECRDEKKFEGHCVT